MGTAIILAQGLVAIVLLPAIWWVSYSRMQGILPYLFGTFVLVMVLALVSGEAQPSVSISMYYNRWSWAFAFIVIVLAVIPPQEKPRQNLEGLIIGIGMAALLLTKITYFAAFAVPVLVALLLHRWFRTVLVALLSGLAVLLALTMIAGVDFWSFYVQDLLLVALGEVRPSPDQSLSAVLGSPATVGANLILIFAIVMLRQAREAETGLVLLLLTPGFFFVTFQNYGNDPQWLLLLAILVLASQPKPDVKNTMGWDMRSSLKITAATALAFAAPSFINLVHSPIRNFAVDNADYMPILVGAEAHTDLQVSKLRGNRVDARIAFDRPGSGMEAYADIATRPDPTILQGEVLLDCTVEVGIPAWFESIATDLDNAGLAKGKRIFVADIVASEWLFGSSLPLINGAPWYYGGLPGFDSADYVLVPLCPIALPVRQIIVDTIAERGIELTEIRRTPLYILLKPNNI